MIFQQPQASLNPLYTIGDQMISILRLHRSIPIKEAQDEAVKLLSMVKMPDPENHLKHYPHQFKRGDVSESDDCNGIVLSPKITDSR